MFIGGVFSSRPDDPFRVDAEALAALTMEDLADGFQAGPDNPLVGLDGRVALLNRLGQTLAASPDVFGQVDSPRPGGLYDVMAAGAEDGRIRAPAVLEALLVHLGPIWPGRVGIAGVDLGDTWRHPLARAEDATDGLVPFHKLSQWLSYSLIEPLEWAGFSVVDIDGLTGLPEYRNGGLFLDAGVLALKRPEEAAIPHEVGSRLVVEWRALSVALLDRWRRSSAKSSGCAPRTSARKSARRRHLGDRTPPRARAPRRRRPAAPGHQRRNGVLSRFPPRLGPA
jgi:hypothetical protein